MVIRKAISIRQPWAYAIIHAGKAIENRSWPTRFRGAVAIHASKALDTRTLEDFFRFIDQRGLGRVVGLTKADAAHLPRGAVIGIADIADCVTASSSPWFEGPFGFVLANPRPLQPISCKGALQFFTLPAPVIAAIDLQVGGRLSQAGASRHARV
jgi:hypothetical protein